MESVDRATVDQHFRTESLGPVRKYKKGIPKVMTDIDMGVVHLPACERHRVGTNRYEPFVPGFALLWGQDYRSLPQGTGAEGWTRDEADAKRYKTFQRAVMDGKRLAKELT